MTQGILREWVGLKTTMRYSIVVNTPNRNHQKMRGMPVVFNCPVGPPLQSQYDVRGQLDLPSRYIYFGDKTFLIYSLDHTEVEDTLSRTRQRHFHFSFSP
jgi:hypothetical protein